MSVEHNERIIHQSVEMAAGLLEQPAVSDAIGERTERLLGLLGRIVVVGSNQFADDTPGVGDPNAIPVLAVTPQETVTLRKGTHSLTDVQRQVVEGEVGTWGSPLPIGPTLDQLLWALKDPDAPVSYQLKEGAGALAVSEAMALPIDEMRTCYDLPEAPRKKLLRISLRPTVILSRGTDVQPSLADVLIHELVHVDQKEQRPITTFSSQADADDLALRDELEAYHAGACVRMILEGHMTTPDKYTGRDPYLQVAVDRIRRRLIGAHNADQFRPSRKMYGALARAGFTPERMLSGRLDYAATMKRFSADVEESHARPKRPKARKPSGRYTPPAGKHST